MDPDLKFGFELETVGVPAEKVINEMRTLLNPIPVIQSRRHKEYLAAWAADYETALLPPTGCPNTCEVKSRLNPTDSEILNVIKLLRKLGCKTTRHCGMHIHVSHSSSPVRSRLPPVEIWSNRLSEAAPKEDPTLTYHKRGMGVAQLSPSHIEVRLFNATLDPDLVLANIKLTLASIHLEPCENEWTSIPVEYHPDKA